MSRAVRAVSVVVLVVVLALFIVAFLGVEPLHLLTVVLALFLLTFLA